MIDLVGFIGIALLLFLAFAAWLVVFLPLYLPGVCSIWVGSVLTYLSVYTRKLRHSRHFLRGIAVGAPAGAVCAVFVGVVATNAARWDADWW